MNLNESPEFIMTEQELFVSLGDALKPFGFAIDDRSKKEKERAGRNWLSANLKQLKSTICTSPKVISYLGNKSQKNRATVISAVLDAILSMALAIPSPIAVAVLLVNHGLEEFCEIAD